MKILLSTLNAKYIHKNLALRWLYVARNQAYDTKIIEFTIKDDIEKIAMTLLEEKADVICLSCYIWNIQKTMELAQYLKKNQSQLKIILGGPEVSFESESLLNQGVDAISIGEGELALWEYIDSLSQNHPHEIAGMCTLEHPNHHYAYSDLKMNEQWEDPYFLEFDLMDLDKRYFYFETSRGCPYGCEYCLSSTDQKVRLFSEEYIFEILSKIKDSSIRQVKFLDRTFNVKPKRALRIARYINEHCKNQIFQFEIVAETLSEELLDFFVNEADKKRFRFEVGVQSFNANTLKAVGRIQNNERLQAVITRLSNADVVMHVDLIAGLPYEGVESFRKSFNKLFSLGASELQLGILKLLKGTAMKRKSGLYGFVYDEMPPYEIKETTWLNENELKRINACALAVEKYWNSGKCRRSIALCLQLGIKESAFDFFLDLGVKLMRYDRRYHDHDLFLVLKECLIGDDLLIDSILLFDYMALSKQKPKRLSLLRVSEEERAFVFQRMMDAKIMNQNQLHHYALVEYAYLNECGYQVVLYNANQSLPKRWFVDRKGRIEEI